MSNTKNKEVTRKRLQVVVDVLARLGLPIAANRQPELERLGVKLPPNQASSQPPPDLEPETVPSSQSDNLAAKVRLVENNQVQPPV